MLWAYVVDICCGDMLETYVVDIRWLHRSMDTLQAYVTGIRWLHRAWVYGGARNVGGCSVPGLCRWGWGGVDPPS